MERSWKSSSSDKILFKIMFSQSKYISAYLQDFVSSHVIVSSSLMAGSWPLDDPGIPRSQKVSFV